MTDDRIDQRAATLLPEERVAGSADPQTQAAAILADSDDREDHPEADSRAQIDSSGTQPDSSGAQIDSSGAGPGNSGRTTR